MKPKGMKTKALYTILLEALFLFGSIATFAQSPRLYVNAGFSPLHKTAQNDFSSRKIPYQLGLKTIKRHLVADLDYQRGGIYQKENFSFKSSYIALGISYLLKPAMRPANINPFAGFAISYNYHQFTTEGYPGISSYEYKIEKDAGPGVSALLGFYYPLNNLILGLNSEFSKGSKASFLAGGFSEQELITDRFKLNITAAIPLNFITKKLRNAQLDCPEY